MCLSSRFGIVPTARACLGSSSSLVASRWSLPIKLSVSVPAAFVLGHVDAGIVLVTLQVVPVFNELVGLELVRRDQVTVLAAGVGHPPVVEEELVGWGGRIDAQLGQTDAHVDVLQVQPAYAERGLVDELGHVPWEHVPRAWAEDRVALARVQLRRHVPFAVLVSVWCVAPHQVAGEVSLLGRQLWLQQLLDEILRVDKHVTVCFHHVGGVWAIGGHPVHTHQGFNGQVVVGVPIVLLDDVVVSVALFLDAALKKSVRLLSRSEQEETNEAQAHRSAVVSPRVADGVAGVSLAGFCSYEKDEEGGAVAALEGLIQEVPVGLSAEPPPHPHFFSQTVIGAHGVPESHHSHPGRCSRGCSCLLRRPICLLRAEVEQRLWRYVARLPPEVPQRVALVGLPFGTPEALDSVSKRVFPGPAVSWQPVLLAEKQEQGEKESQREEASHVCPEERTLDGHLDGTAVPPSPLHVGWVAGSCCCCCCCWRTASGVHTRSCSLIWRKEKKTKESALPLCLWHWTTYQVSELRWT